MRTLTNQQILTLNVLLFCLVTLLGCQQKSLIPGYEVLSVPASSERYITGAKWIPATGSHGLAFADVNDANGLEKMAPHNIANAEAKLTANFSEWYAAKIGLKSSKDVNLTCNNLKHHFVKDAYGLSTEGLVLWETITAESMTLEIVEDSNSVIDVDLSEDKIKKVLEGELNLNVSSEGNNTYKIKSNRRLVVAIKVVNLDRNAKGKLSSPIDLSDNSIGRPQKAELGYSVIVEGVDHFTEEAELFVMNDKFIGFTGAPYSFIGGKPCEIHQREAIGSDSDYIWDTLSIYWNPDRKKCVLSVKRQTLDIKPAKSGLKGVK